MQTRHISTPYNIEPREDAPGLAWRGIFAGLWLTSTSIILITLVPGIGMSLGNLPGDFYTGANDGSMTLPIASITLVVVTLTGICCRIFSFLSRH